MKRYLGGLALYFAGGIIFTQKDIWALGVGLLLGAIGWSFIFLQDDRS